MTHVAQDQQQAPGASLPDSLDELGNAYDPFLRDRIVDEVEALEYTNGTAYTADQRRGISEQVASYADADTVAIGYSVAIALVGQEKWWDSHTWRLYADLIDTALDPDVGEPVDLYIPEDTGQKITSRTDLSSSEIQGVMRELRSAAETYPVDGTHSQSLPGGKSLSASAAAACAASECCPGDTVFATYSDNAHTIAEMCPGLDTADPADLYAALDMNRGPYDLAPLNRVATAIQWFGEPGEFRTERVPGPLMEAPDVQDIDAAVVDESAGVEVSLQRDRNHSDWTDTLAFLDTAVQDGDVDVYVPDGLPADMKDNVGGEAGRRVRDDIQALTTGLRVPAPASLDIPDRFEDMEGDYAIAHAAREQGDNILVVTYDDHFDAISGVAAVTPGLGADLIERT